MKVGNIILLLFALWCAPLFLLGQVSFRADTDTKQIAAGGTFQVKFTLANAHGAAFTPPSFADFAVVAGPNRMNSMTMINGNASSSETYSYGLLAKKEGKYTIGPASIQVGGKTLQTNSLTVEVVKGKQSASTPDFKGSAKDAVFIRAEVNHHEAHVGQQLVLDYKLYTRVSLNGVNLLHESEYPGFYKQEINAFNRAESAVTLGGKRYIAKILNRVALYPLKEGELTIDPLSVQIGTVKSNGSSSGDPIDDLFNMPVVQTVNVQSNPVIVQVKPLPPNAPASFTGAVGSYEMEASIGRTQASTDDVISLKLTVKGNGDPKRLQPQPLAPMDGLEYYEPKILSDLPDEAQGEITATKEIEYLIAPKKPGTYTLKPVFTYFSETEDRYVTLSPQTFELTITQGTNKPAQEVAGEGTKARGDIRYIKTNTHLYRKGVSFFGSPLFGGLALAPFAMFGGVAAYKRFRRRQANLDIRLIKRRGASKVAQRRLAIAHDHMKSQRNRSFYDEVSRAMFGYVADKLNIPLSDFSKNTVKEKLSSLNVSSEQTNAFIKVLQDCEMALFAGKESEGDMNVVYQKALGVITQIEKELKSDGKELKIENVG